MNNDELKRIFTAYEKVRKSGEFNMIMDAKDAWTKVGLSPTEYYFVIQHYNELYELFGE